MTFATSSALFTGRPARCHAPARSSTITVLVIQGQTALTLILCVVGREVRSERVRPNIPCFEAPYTGRPGDSVKPAMELTRMSDFSGSSSPVGSCPSLR
ncbi:uncharacterized protein BDW70DRAFT_144076 [Aspergillus foveolatus]|uniref:uncharacterized protein n=1 Tax=Aspergillus foveolatus TaxID=210207 RepID=UPI003CCE4FD6